MRLIAFDTSSPAISAVAVDGAMTRSARHEHLDRGHAERILPLLAELLAEAGWAWGEVDLVAVALGPGNFTSVRAGIAVARALVLALGCRAMGLGSLEILAESAAGQAVLAEPIDVVVDARRNEVYAQRFAYDLTPLTEPALVPVEEFATSFLDAGLLVGDAAAALAAQCRSPLRVLAGDRDPSTLARLVARRLAAGAAAVPPTGLRPVYVRAPDARPGAGASLLHVRA